MRKKQKREKLRIIAEAIVQAGYGTDWYDPSTNECHHECYASFIKIISGDWNEYDTSSSAMDKVLNTDFNLGFTFDVYLIRKYSDGTKRRQEVKWDFENSCIEEEENE